MTDDTRKIAESLINKNIPLYLRDELVFSFSQALDLYGQKRFEDGVKKVSEIIFDSCDCRSSACHCIAQAFKNVFYLIPKEGKK